MIKRLLLSACGIAFLFLQPASALAASYSFSVPEETVHVYWNADGTSSIDYSFVFQNDTGASPIDYVDVGLPNANYDIGSIWATVDDASVSDIQNSEYVQYGVAVGLGSKAIRSGQRGTVHVYIGRITGVLYPDDNDAKYASAVFSPTWFSSDFTHGSTNLTVIFHLPPGIQTEEPRYHIPQSWPGASEPVADLDTEGRVTYTWNSASANATTQYTFGASFPARVVPDSAIVRPSIFDKLYGLIEPLLPFTCICCVGAFFIGIGALSVWADNRRKKQYLPPKISIEGHGIKRGLTAVEAAVLMEQPLDKVMTMILFGVVKKGAATVLSREPLKIQAVSPLPEGLNAYETDFLAAFATENIVAQRKALQDTTVNLIKSLTEKMKGFSRKETIDYYQTITEKAWQQVTAAGTPDVKAQALNDNLEWTMTDRNFNDRSREIWQSGPVFVPMWWGHYDPRFGRATPSVPQANFGPTGPVHLPQLPGADFAQSVVGGIHNFSSNVIGDLTGFTSRVTNTTNPLPKPSSSGGSYGGGRSCACACACAGCACACAGGGR